MSVRWRLLLIGTSVALCAFLAAASFVPEEQRRSTWWLPDDAMRLGLDLQGGIHMVLGPDLDVAVAHELQHIRGGLEQDLQEAGIQPQRLVVEADRIVVEADAEQDLTKLRETLAGIEIADLRDAGSGSFELRLTSAWQKEVRERAVLQALEVLRRRVDDPKTGIPESVVTRQGADRILVQIPGVSRVPDIFRPGFLEFKIVKDSALSEELLRAKYSDGLPEGSAISFELEPETQRVLRAYLVDQAAPVTGELLSDARVAFDSQRSEWQVSFTWNAEGARVFGELTEKNIGQPLGILLDGQMYSAPVIRDRISRNGVITGRFSSEDARDLAIVLRAGALSIPVKVEEERSLGPALGADSIRRGLNACVLGLLLVTGFSVAYYRISGLYASVTQLVNLALLLGLMSLFGGTLTLPGIAGLVLTVGMAVDGNVIIFERIREELRAGKAVRTAIATAFQKVFWTIMDANISILITAIVLYEYGTGPIKGFAVTLSVGILTSVFTVLVVTRLLFDIHPGHRNVTRLSI